MTGPLAIVFAAILWSIDGLLRQSLYSAPSLLIVALEHVFGALLFLPFLIWKRDTLRSISSREWGSLLWVSIWGGILGTYLYTAALGYIGYIDLSVVVLLQKLQPFFAILLAALLLKERLTPRFLGLALVAIVGAYFVTFPDLQPVMDLSSPSLIASLLAIGAAFAWGSSTVFSKHALVRHPFVVITGLRLTITAILAATLVMLFGQHAALPALEPAQWQALLLIVVSTGAVALGIYYYGLKRVPASHSTIYEMAWPLSALAIDWYLHGNVLTVTQWMGAALLLGAIVFLPRERQ